MGGGDASAAPAASSVPGNRRELAWRKFWGRTGFPSVPCPSNPCPWGTGGQAGNGAGHGAMLAAVPPAGLWGKEAEILPGLACGSHYFEKLHLAWENGTGAAVGLLYAQGQQWLWNPKSQGGTRVPAVPLLGV